MFNGDRGRKPGDGIHVWFLKLFHKLAGIGVETVEITALAFGKEKVKSQGAFAGSRKSSDDDHLVLGNLEIEVFQVVMAGTPDGNTEWGAYLFGERGLMEAEGF